MEQEYKRRWRLVSADEIETEDGYSICWSDIQSCWVVCYRSLNVGKYWDLLTAMQHTDAFRV